MASAALVEAAALAGRAPRLEARGALRAQAGGALVPLARHGDEGPAARTGGRRMTADVSPSDFCRDVAHHYGANFSVGFRFLPRVKRRAVYAAYAFCRWADDIADEPGDDVLRRLDEWQAELDRCYAGQPTHPITVALADALHHFPIPRSAFIALINGCRQDVVKHRYETFDELLHYCELVATSISDISLAIFGHRTHAAIAYDRPAPRPRRPRPRPHLHPGRGAGAVRRDGGRARRKKRERPHAPPPRVPDRPRRGGFPRRRAAPRRALRRRALPRHPHGRRLRHRPRPPAPRPSRRPATPALTQSY